MYEEQKYFGMTRAQIGILAGMGAVLLLIVCVGGWFVFRNLSGGAPAAPAGTPTIAPTVTPMLALQPTPTPTVVQTPVPYEQLIPAGWIQFKTALVEIWLPSNFKLSDRKTDEYTLGFVYPALAITEIPSRSSAYNMQVRVSYEPLIGDSLDAFLDEHFPKLPYQSTVTDRRTVYINSVEARRLTIEFRINNVDANDMVYVLLDGSTVWYVEFAAELTEFFENLPIFEQSIQTFRPVRY